MASSYTSAVFAGSNAKILKQNLDLNGSVSILSGSVDPSSVATSAPKGSLYLNNSNGNLYRKTDAGLSTNWVVNTTDVTLTAFGSVPNSNAASLSGQALTLQPADGSNPGGVSTTTQTFAGAKTFSTSATSPIFKSSTSNPASVGVVRLANTEKVAWRNLANSIDNSIWVENDATLGGDAFVFDGAGSAPYSSAIFLDWPTNTLNNRGLIYAGLHAAGDAFIDAGTNSAYQINGSSINQINFSAFDSSGGPLDPVIAAGTINSVSTSCGTSSFFKARGIAATPTVSVNGDSLGQIIAYGHDGTDFEAAAKILFTVNNTPANNVMPGAIIFQTTPDSSNTPATAVSINRNKQLALFGGGIVSSSSLYSLGSIFTGGSATTTKPHIWVEPLGATSNNWSTSGTALGINPAGGFVGNLIDTQVNAVAKFKVDSTGQITSNSLTASLPVQTDGSKNLVSSAIDLSTSQVTGNLGVSHLNSGTNASSSTFWRGDATWVRAITSTVDTFSGDNSTTGFTLSVSPVSVNYAQVYISGVYQQKASYTVSGTTLTFGVAPPTGTNNIEVVSLT